MHQEQRDRAQAYLSARGIHHALFASQWSITWLTGFMPPLQIGASAVSGGPALLWYEDGTCTLIVMESLNESACATGCPVITYVAQSIDEPLSGPNNLSQVLAGLLAPRAAAHGPLGMELDFLTARLAEVLKTGLPNMTWVALDHALDHLRVIKTAEELETLQYNFDLADIGQAAARAAVSPGASEIEVWAAAQSAIIKAAGGRVPLGNDCISGRRANNIGGWPLDIVLNEGDSIIVDISTILRGYWSDGCATYYAGAPSERQVAIHETVQAALDLGISMARPGTPAKAIDYEMKRFIASRGYPVYPHHGGHGIGVTGHEEPRIVPYNEMKLEAGMVIMLEPGIYFPTETGARLENAMLITESGAKVLTHHDKSLP